MNLTNRTANRAPQTGDCRQFPAAFAGIWGLSPVCPMVCCLALFLVGAAPAQELAPVVSRPISRTVDLPGEFQPFLSVSLHAKVSGFVERVLVDRGSVVHHGDLLVELSAPEIKARIAEAESK